MSCDPRGACRLPDARRAIHGAIVCCALWLLLVFCATASAACGLESAPLTDAEGDRVLDVAEMSILRDPGRQLTIDDVSSPDGTQGFTPLKGGLSLGFTTDAVWLKVCIRRAPEATPEWWLEFRGPYVDDVRLYSRRSEAGNWHESRAGDRYPVSKRELPYRTIVFPVTLRNAEPGVFYFRVVTSSTMSTAITAGTPRAFRIQAQKDLLLIGAMVGILLAMLMTHLANGLWTGQRVYLGFAGFTLIVLLAVLSGYGLVGQYLFPDSDWVAHAVLNTSIYLFYAAAMLTARRPLRLKEHFPWFDRLLPYLAGVTALASLSTLFELSVYVMPWVRTSQIVFVVIGATAALKSLRQGHTYARWILLAYTGYAVPMLIGISRVLGLISWNINFEPTAPAVLEYALFLHFGVLTELREQAAKRQSAENEAESQRKLTSQEERLRGEQATFFAFVAHELRNPLGVLYTGLTNLRRSLAGTEHDARIERLNQAARRLGDLVDRHLDLQNLSQTDFKPCLATGQPEQPAQDALQAQRQLHAARHFEYAPPAALLGPISMDAELVTLALSNLLDNAAKYAFEQSPIRLEIEPGPQSISYHVINDGPGLPPELGERAFKVFQRTQGEGREKGGFGIGLALASHVAAAHGGHLASRHANGQTRFTLTLPA